MKRKQPVLWEQASSPLFSALCYLLVAVCYCSSVSYAIHSVSNLEYSFIETFICCGVFLILFYLLTYNRITSLICILVIPLAAAGMFFAGKVSPYWNTVVTKLTGDLKTIWELTLGAPFDFDYAFPMFILLCMLCALYTTIFMRKLFSFFALFLPGVVVFVLELFLELFESPEAFFVFLASSLVLFLMQPGSRFRYRRRAEFVFGPFALTLVPVVLATVLTGVWAASFFPKESALRYSLVQNGTIQGIGDLGGILRDTGIPFQFSSTGFSPDPRKLGGDISLDRSPVMKVSVDGSFSQRLYLAGAYKNRYDGTMWTADETDFSGYDPHTDYSLIERNALFHDWLSEYGEAQMEKTTVRVSPIGHTARTIFTSPMRYTGILTDTSMESDQYGALQAVPGISAGSSYEFSYFTSLSFNVVNALSGHSGERRSDWMANMIEVAPEMGYQPEYQLQYANGGNFYGYYDEVFGVGIREEYISHVYEAYTGLPSDLPERITALAESIVEDSEGLRAMQKIEAYLRTFPYTFTPGDIPEGRDFVDYFLFDRQEGYCVYFATAMCILARSAGYPSRYAQGYVSPGSVSGSEFTITNAQAHAWPEIYIPNIGWTVFEPTPGYQSQWSSADGAPALTPDMEDNADMREHLEDTGRETKPREPDERNSSEREQDQPQPAPRPENQSPLDWDRVITITVVLVLLLALAGLPLFLRWKYRKAILRRIGEERNPRRAILQYMMEIERLLAIDNSPRFPHETPRQYGQRIEKKYRGTFAVSECMEIYSKVLYSTQSVPGEEKNEIVRAYQNLDRCLKEKLPRPLYLYYFLFPRKENQTAVKSEKN